MFHSGEPPQIYPEQLDLSEDEEELEIEYIGRIMQAASKALSLV